MVMDALRGYVQLASGLTEVTRQRAQQAAKQLLQQTGADSLTSGLTGKAGDLADEIVATSKSNRALLQAIIGNEVEGAVAKLGFVRAEEVAALRRRIDRLEQEKAAAAATPTTAPTATPTTAATATPSTASSSAAGAGGGSTAKKAPVKKTAAKNVAGKKAAKKSASKAVVKATGKTVAPKTTPSTPLKSASKAAKKSAKKSAAKKA